MKTRIAVILAPLLVVGLSLAASSPADASTGTIKIYNSSKSYTGVIVHGTNATSNPASSVKSPALIVERGQTKSGTINGNNCAVWVPAHSKVTWFELGVFLTGPARWRTNNSEKGYDWIFAKGGNCNVKWEMVVQHV